MQLVVVVGRVSFIITAQRAAKRRRNSTGMNLSRTHIPVPFALPGGAQIMVARWVIGVILSLGGCTLSNTGVNFQKMCHTKLAAQREAGIIPKPYYLQPLWVGGLLGIVIGSVMDLVSFAFASLSLLAPLGAMVRDVGSSCDVHCVLFVPYLRASIRFVTFLADIPLSLSQCHARCPLCIMYSIVFTVFSCVRCAVLCRLWW